MRNNKRWLLICLPLLMVVLALPAAVALAFGEDLADGGPSYRFITIDLPTPEGQFGFTTLADINEKGEITGGFTDSNLGSYGFLLDQKIKSTDIRCSKNTVSTEPQGINKHGEIAGVATVITDRIKIRR